MRIGRPGCTFSPKHPNPTLEAPLDPPSVGDRLIALGAVLLFAFMIWMAARWAARYLRDRTRLGLRGLEGIAAPLSLLALAAGAWLLNKRIDEPPIVRAGLEMLLLVGTFWLLIRLLDASFATGRRSARLRADPVAGAALITAHHVAKALVVLSVIAVVAVRLGATEQLYLALGALGAALVFAARDPIRNAFAFASLIIDPPFHVGDRVRIGDFRGGADVEGTVMDLNLGSVTIRTRSRTLVVIQHITLSRLRVENLSSSNRRRLEFVLPVPSSMPAEDVRAVCDDIESDLVSSSLIVDERRPHVWLSGVGDGLKLKASMWLRRGVDRREAQRDLLLAANARLRARLPEG